MSLLEDALNKIKPLLDNSFIRLAVKSRENNEVLLDMLRHYENIRRI